MIDVIAAGVPNQLDSLPPWFELLVMTINSAFGAAIARSRNVPIYGTIFAGLLVGFGGGMMRDMLLGLEPVAISVWYYLPAGILGAIIGALLFSDIVVMSTVDLFINGIVIGLLVTIGAQKALEYNAPMVSAIFLGVITASFGGLLADVMSGYRATVAKQAHWVASALVVGSVLFVLLSPYVNFWITTAIAVAGTTFFRVVSQKRNWPSPRWRHESLETT